MRRIVVSRIVVESVIVGAHATALIVFVEETPAAGLPSSWPAQVVFLLGLSLLLCTAAVFVKARPWKLITVCGFVGLAQILVGIPEGASLTIEFLMATAFLIVVNVVLARRTAVIVATAYGVLTVSAQLPFRVWNLSVPAPPALHLALFAAYQLLLIVLFGMVGSQYSYIVELETERVRLAETAAVLSSANREFQEYASHARALSAEAERRRIAREVHDTVGYTLTNVQIMMEAARELVKIDHGRLDLMLQAARDQAQEGLMETRRAMRILRDGREPAPVGKAQVDRLVRTFREATHISISTDYGNTAESFGPRIDGVVYRMLQESLTNSFRHGRASRIDLRFWVIDGTLRVAIRDNGGGAAEISPGVGLAGMRERLEALGGRLVTESTRYGFSVYAEIPLVEYVNGNDSNAIG